MQVGGRKISFGDDGDALMMLIFINVIVFIILKFIFVVYQLSGAGTESFKTEILPFVVLPSHFNDFVSAPWTIITHFLTLESFWLLLSNMLWLWVFGQILQGFSANNNIIPLFLYGGLAGGVLFLLSMNLIPAFSNLSSADTLMGPSTGIMAIAIAATLTAPDYRFFPMIGGGIPLWVITLIYVIVDFSSFIGRPGPYYISQFGGILIGFFFFKQYQAGRNWGGWMLRFYDWFINLFNPERNIRARNIRYEVFYNTKGKVPYKKTPNVTQEKVDAILDKIAEHGFEYLSAEEKDILKRASEDKSL